MAHNQPDADQQLMKQHVGVGVTKVYATNVMYHWIAMFKVKFEATAAGGNFKSA